MYYNGCFLISTPEMEGSVFDRSVVLICEHNEEGATGLIINKESKIKVNELADTFPCTQDLKTHFMVGGPVAQEEVLVLHDMKSATDRRLDISDDLFMTTNPAFLNTISASQLEYCYLQFFLGYSGWSAGQIESEIERGSWTVCPLNMNIIRESPFDKMWSQSLHDLGGDFACKAFLPKDPNRN
ncbi:MAG: hypothetical protein COA79_23510 [Planctomycetota bacterium]|nr:MAG: hypothetical protein COA79_23510 [Planctomycetota bacterium]